MERKVRGRERGRKGREVGTGRRLAIRPALALCKRRCRNMIVVDVSDS